MATQLQLLINMVASSFGAGILSMPWATAGASLVPALAVLLLITLLMICTVSLLIHSAERYKKTDLGSLLGELPGAAGWVLPMLVNVSLWGTLWLTLVGYNITIADALTDFLPSGMTSANAELCRTVIVIAFSAIVLPLCYMDMSKLSFTSFLSVIATGNLFAIMCYNFAEEGANGTRPADVCWFGMGKGLVSMASMCFQSLIVQMCALQMYGELDAGTPEKFDRITAIAFGMLFVIYAAFSSIGYLGYGQHAHSNILENLPENIWGKASRISYVLVIMAAYPIFLYPMASSLRNAESLLSRGINTRVVANTATVVIVLSAMGAAMVMRDLGFINAASGAVQCAIFVGVCPGLVGIYLSGSRGEHLLWKSLMVGLFLLCCLVGGVGIVYTDNYAQDLVCKWNAPPSGVVPLGNGTQHVMATSESSVGMFF